MASGNVSVTRFASDFIEVGARGTYQRVLTSGSPTLAESFDSYATLAASTKYAANLWTGYSTYVAQTDGQGRILNLPPLVYLSDGITWNKVTNNSTVVPNQLFAQRPLRIIPIGDSICQGGDVAVGTTGALWQFSLGTSYTTSGIFLAGRNYQLIRNAGIAGQTSTQIAARLQSDALAYSPDAVLIALGTNDLPAINTSYSSGMTVLMNNIQTMVKQCLSAGVLPILCTVPPNGTRGLEAKLTQWFYYDLARSWRIPLFDAYRLMVDPVSASGQYLAGMSGDGTHPQYAGVAVLAPALATLLKNLTTCAPYTAAFSEVTEGTTGLEANMLRNGNFARVTTPPNPDGWGTAGGVGTTTTPTASSPYNGNTFTRVITSGAQYLISGGYVPTTTAITAGTDILQFSGAVNANISSYAGGYSLGINDTSTGQQTGLYSAKLNGQQDFSFRFLVPSNWVNAYCACYSSGDAGTITMNNLTLVNVTRQRNIWSPVNPE